MTRGPRPAGRARDCCIAALALAAATLAAGCTRRPAANPCATAAGPWLLEDRTQAGAPLILVRRLDTGALVVCDGSERALGTLSAERAPSPIALRNAAGDVEAQMSVPAPGDDPVVTQRGRRVRLHEEHGVIRFLDEIGVPLAQLGRTDDGPLRLWDPAGRSIATAEPVTGDPTRRAIHASDGAVTHLVIGAGSDRAAAAFGLETIPIESRLLVSRWLDRAAAP